MSTTDQAVHTEIQHALVETVDAGVSYASGIWTVQEVADALIRWQNRLLRETGVVVSRTTLMLIPNTPRAVLPQAWMATRRVAWQRPTGAYVPLWRMSWQEADTGRYSWAFNMSPTPYGYLEPEDVTPPLLLHFVPDAQDTGIPQLWYLATGSVLSNTGVLFTVPDELVATVKWGALSDLLRKEGRGYDPERATACEARYTEGRALAVLNLVGDTR